MKALMKDIKIGDKNHMFGKTYLYSTQTKTLMSTIKGGGIIFVYNTQSTLVNFSTRKAAEFFNCSYMTIVKYVKSKQLF